MSTTGLNNFNDYNLNIIENDDPRLEGYLPVEYFRIVDTDYPSSRIRDVSIPIEQFYDYNLENACGCEDDNEED